MKEHKYILIILTSIMLLILFLNTYNYKKQISINHEILSKELSNCNNNSISEKQEYCERISVLVNEKPDFYTTFMNIFILGFRNYAPLFFIIIAIPTIFITSKYYNKNIIFNFLQREKYKQYLLKILYKTYKSLLIFIIPIMVAFLMCYLFSKSFDFSYSLKYSSVVWSKSLLAKPAEFLILYLFVVMLYTAMYVNICLIVAYKFTDFWKTLICAFLTIIGTEMFLEIFINNILFSKILNSEYGNAFNILSIITFDDSWGLLTLIGLPIIYFLFTSFILIILYKNEERFLCELSEER